jgi:hypothetical protein
MVGKFAFPALAAALMASAGQAQVLYSDGFESYNLGALDANLAGGPNQAPNGGPGNPWFGPVPPNVQVVASGDGGVTAHGGTKMGRGNAAGNDFDQDWYNLAYRLNGGNAFRGNVAMKWYFYDPLGSGGTAYQDFGALGTYNTAATAASGGTDYTAASGGNLNPGGASQRLSLGAAPTSNQDGTFDGTKYQLRVAGATDGYDGGGWINSSVTRSPGWHFAEILNTPVLTHALLTNGGVNVMELNAAYGPTTGYYDDVSFSAVPVPEPSSLLLMASGLALVWRRRHRSAN